MLTGLSTKFALSLKLTGGIVLLKRPISSLPRRDAGSIIIEKVFKILCENQRRCSRLVLRTQVFGEVVSINKMSKYIHKYILNPFTVIVLCLFIRLLLLLSGWPHSNIDESTVGEMAINIAYHGDHPVFFYGQNYMGALQAYLAAGMFVLTGASSLFNLRLAQLLLVALFLTGIYLLTRLLYSRGLALFTTFLLGFGNYLTIYRETQAIGGYPDTLAFGTLILLLASWLALTSPTRDQSIELRWKRVLAFAGWGLAAGLGLWSDLLIMPSLIMSGLLLLLVCRREWRSLAPLAVVGGLILGALPLILFNITAPPGQNSLATLQQIYNHGNTPLIMTLPQTLKSALLVGLPTFSNFPAVCSVNATLFMGGYGRRALACTLLQGGWSGVVILLWLGALLLAAWMIVRNRGQRQEEPTEQRRMTIVALARLSILLSAGMSFALYAASTTAIYEPYLSSRYLIAILIATPALLYPLWHGIAILRGRRRGLIGIANVARTVALAGIACCYLLGTFFVFTTVPGERVQNQQEVALVQTIMRLGVKHVYSDFWTCDNIIFISKTRVLCNTTNEYMKPNGSRYQPFGLAVLADPKADYIFPINSPHARECKQFLAEHEKKYQRYEINNYVIYRLL